MLYSRFGVLRRVCNASTVLALWLGVVWKYQEAGNAAINSSYAITSRLQHNYQRRAQKCRRPYVPDQVSIAPVINDQTNIQSYRQYTGYGPRQGAYRLDPEWTGWCFIWTLLGPPTRTFTLSGFLTANI